jgi:hypothetical protein
VSGSAWAICPDFSGNYLDENGPGSLTSQMTIHQNECEEAHFTYANGMIDLRWQMDGQARPVNPEWTETSYWSGNRMVNEVSMKNGFKSTIFEKMDEARLKRVIEQSTDGGPIQRFETIYRRQ